MTVSDWAPRVIGGLLYQAHRAARAATNQALRPERIELRHIGVLGIVEQAGPHSQRHLGEALGLDKSTMVRIIDELERQRLAERRPGPHDRRIHHIAITPSGRERLHAAQQRTDLVMGELLSVFTPSECAQLHDLLTRFVAHARGHITPDIPGTNTTRRGASLPDQRCSATGDLDDASTPAGS